MALAFHVENFGCRAARADGEAVSERLRALGHGGVERISAAEVVVVNTCSVTAEADREARAYIRRVHRQNPEARIMVTGCYAQRAPQELAALPGVAAVVGNSHKAWAPEIAASLGIAANSRSIAATIHALQPEPLHSPTNGTDLPGQSLPAFVDLRALTGAPSIFADDRFAHSFLEEAQVAPGVQTRPNLKIQEGCSNRCSFCVIPQTRGSSRSLSEDSILRQVQGFVAAGGNELVFSGINMGRWGLGLDASHTARPSLARLVRRIFAETKLPRLRLSSIEPMDWDAELIELMREFGGTRLARHAHLPLQSGSDAVLRRMHRRYRPWHYAEKVASLVNAAGPELTLGADVMVGFPGETDAEFAETVQFIRQLPFGYLHLFPFSPRPQTRAWELHRESPVATQIVEERMRQLRALAAEKLRRHRAQFIGKQMECLTLHTSAQKISRSATQALSENFIPVEIAAAQESNRRVRVHISGLTHEDALIGCLVA